MGYATAMWLGFGEALAAVVASVLGGVINAWLFLVNVAGRRRRPKVRLCTGAGLEPGTPSARWRVT